MPGEMLSLPTVTNTRSVIIHSLQGRATSSRFHLTLQGSLRVHVVRAVRRVNLFWSSKTLQSLIAAAWRTILTAEPDHIVIHPVVPAERSKKTARAFWHFCAEVCRWHDDRGCHVTIMHPSHSACWSSQCSRSLKWRRSMSFVTVEIQGEQSRGELSFLSKLPEGSLDRLDSLVEGYDSTTIFDPRFTIQLSQCVTGHRHSDLRQGFSG